MSVEVVSAVALAAVTVLLASALTRAAGRLSFKLGFVAYPDALHYHPRPTPLLGGLAIATAVAPAVAVIAIVESSFWFFFMGAWTSVCFLGLLKDKGVEIPPAAQLATQCGAGAVLLVGGLALPFNLPYALAAVGVVLFVPAIVNAVNFLDVSDGLAASSTGVIFMGYFFLFLLARMPSDALVALCFASATGGFLFHNRPPASVFMGDCGSFGLGFVVAALALRAASSPWLPGYVALIPCLLPLAELTGTALLRLIARRSPFVGDGKHLSTLLAKQGIRPGALMFMASATALASCAVSLVLAGFPDG